MNHRIGMVIIILSLAILPILSSHASALELEGESSRVTVRADINIHSNGILTLKFKVLWGDSEFKESNIFQPKAVPAVLPWSDLSWTNLSRTIEPISTIRYLFESKLPDGKTIVDSGEAFVTSILDIDVSFTITSVKPRILKEFDTIEIRVDLEPSKNSYTIAPLKCLSKIDFHGFAPVTEVQIETGPCVDLQTSSIAINHFLLPEGHRFSSEGLFGIKNDMVMYDSSEDDIHVRKLPPVISSTILYSIWIIAAFLSMIILAVAGKRARKIVSKGFGMWFGIGMVCFFAFLPYHLFLSLLLILMGFYYSVDKAKSLRPERVPSHSIPDDEEEPKKDSINEKMQDTETDEQRKPPQTSEKTLSSEEFKGIIPPSLPLSETTIPKSDESFAPPSPQTSISGGNAFNQPTPPAENRSGDLEPPTIISGQGQKPDETGSPEHKRKEQIKEN